jgi:hypothetical protein
VHDAECNPRFPRGTTEVEGLDRWFANTASVKCLIDGVAEVNSLILANEWDNTNTENPTGHWHLVRGHEAVVSKRIWYVAHKAHCCRWSNCFRVTKWSGSPACLNCSMV